MVREFGSPGPAKPVVDNPVELEFTLYGSDYVFTALPPTGTQMMVMAAAAETGQSLGGLTQFLMGVLSEEDWREMHRRLLDRKDALDLDDLGNLFTWMLEEWGKVPTEGRSGSSASPARGGRGSTAKRRSTALT